MKKNKVPIVTQTSFNICKCGNPAEYGLMIQCDSCQRWYHSTCVKISEVSDYCNIG